MTEKLLKTGWKRVKFGDVVKLYGERSANPAADGFERYVGLEHLEPGDLRIRSWGNIVDGTTFTSRFKPGQVLFGKRRAYQKKVALVDFEGVCSGDIYVFESKDPTALLPELLPFLCQTDAFFEYAVGTSAGSLSPRTNWTSLAGYEFALPPLEEQRRLSRVLCSLETVARQTKILMEVGETALQSLSREFFGSILNGSPIASFGSIAHVVDPNPSHRYPDYADNGVPLVATQDFLGRDSFTFEKAARVPESTWSEQNRRCSFTETDIVFARKGILGLARFYGKERKAFSHTVVLIKPKTGALPSYLLWLLRSDAFMTSILRTMNSNSGVPTLGVKTIESCPVPIPSHESQSEVAGALDGVKRSIDSTKLRLDGFSAIKGRALLMLQGSSPIS